MPRLCLLVVALLAFAAGCSSADQPSPDEPVRTSNGLAVTPSPDGGTPVAPSGPLCTEVWTSGATLPAAYDGCLDAEGRVAEDDITSCEDKTRLVVHDDVSYARTGGRIVTPDISPLQDTEEFGTEYATCTGEDS